MATLKDHLVRILESREFEIEEKDGYLYGRRADVSVVVMAGSDMILDDVQDFVRNISGFSGRKVVASLGKVDDNVQAFLQKNRRPLLGREEIEHEIGSLQLETVTRDGGKSLLDDVISDDAPRQTMEPSDQSIPVIVESTSASAPSGS